MLKLSIFLLATIALSSAFPNLDFSKPYLPWKRGSCLKEIGLKDFQPEKFFNGRWYEISSFGNYLLQADGVCTTLDTEIKGDDINVLYYQYEPILKKYIYFRSKTTLKEVAGATFNLQYDYLAGLASLKVPITVINTDYDNYSIIYSCQEAFGFKAEMSWVLTRARGDETHNAEVENALTEVGLKYDDYIPQNSNGCGPDEPHL